MRCRRFHLILFVSSVFTISACGIHDRVSYSDSEGRLSEKLLAQITKPGTAKRDIVGNLGMPESMDSFSVGNSSRPFEVYNYRLTEKQIRRGHLLYVFNTSVMEANEKFLHVVMRDELVEKAWFDESPTGKVEVRTHPDTRTTAARTQAGMPPAKPMEGNSGKKVYVVPESAPEASTVELQTKSGSMDIETKKTPTFEWKVPILKKWFGPKEKAPKPTVKQASLASEANQMGDSGSPSSPDSSDGTADMNNPKGESMSASPQVPAAEEQNTTSENTVSEGVVTEDVDQEDDLTLE